MIYELIIAGINPNFLHGLILNKQSLPNYRINVKYLYLFLDKIYNKYKFILHDV